jgi:BA14K-like protein
MNKRIAELLGGVAALVTLNAAQAVAATADSQTDPFVVQSYAELLNPVPNAVPLLIADEARRAQQRPFRPRLAQFQHHHHHHNNFSTTTGVLNAIGVISTMQPGYAPGSGVSPEVANCIRAHKTYDPQSGTYTDKKGNPHYCP